MVKIKDNLSQYVYYNNNIAAFFSFHSFISFLTQYS